MPRWNQIVPRSACVVVEVNHSSAVAWKLDKLIKSAHKQFLRFSLLIIVRSDVYESLKEDFPASWNGEKRQERRIPGWDLIHFSCSMD